MTDKPRKTKQKASRERSAGVVIYHGDPAGGPRFLLLDYGRYWDFAKGHVEPGESDLDAARREVREETGLADVDLDPAFSRQITYFFRKNSGKLVHKTVVFFLGRTDTDAVTISGEHVGHAWHAYDEAVAKVAHANAKAVLTAAGDHLGLAAAAGR